MINLIKRVISNVLLLIITIPLILLTVACQASNPTPSRNGKQEGQTSTSAIPARQGLLNDYSNVLDKPTKQRLESTLAQLRQRSGIEFTVVFVDKTGVQSLNDYSMTIINAWGLTPKDTSKGGGILLLIALKDYKWRIKVSQSLWEDLPNGELEELESLMSEPFSEKRYGEGVMRYVEAIIAKLANRRGFKMNNE